ncbi:MAG: peptidoglycan recognition protein family protein, partial [Oscillospiraceae bacterium]|nr:peptidoglycan recognition protein family protein [Oscillospiraceae bacterium]
VPQVGRGRMYIDTPTFSAFNRNNGIQIRGWEMSTTPNSRVEIFINDQRVNAGITRTHRQDVLDRITNFGGQSVNPTPGFQTNINISNLRLGRHRLRVEVVSLDGVVLDTREMNIHVHNVNIIDRGLTFVGPMDTRNRINRIIMHHTGMTVPQTVESIHNTHQNSNGWWGIGYHFYIRRNGNIYRGRPDNVIGGHARGHNFDSLGIAFEGNFNLEQMTPQQRASGQLLVAYLRDKYDIRTIQGHNEVNQTACPGRNFPWWIFR